MMENTVVIMENTVVMMENTVVIVLLVLGYFYPVSSILTPQ